MLSDHRVVQTEPQPTLSVRVTVRGDEIAATLMDILPRVVAYAGENTAGMPFAIWHGVLGSPPSQEFDMEAGVPVSLALQGEGDIRASELPGGSILQVTYRGTYDGMTDAYHELMQWMELEELHSSGPPWDWYLDDPSRVPADQCRTLICWPIQ